MIPELKAVACVLLYPDAALKDDLKEIGEAIAASREVKEIDKKPFDELLFWLRSTPLRKLQSEYVATFDIGKRANLNLFEHMLGDSRERGSAMLNLRKLYEDHGLSIESNEMPDYLPMFLEFLSGLDWPEARIYLEEAAHHIKKIDTALAQTQSPWMGATGILLSVIAESRTSSAPVRDDLIPEIDADSFDRPVTFGANTDPVTQPIRFSKCKAIDGKEP